MDPPAFWWRSRTAPARARTEATGNIPVITDGLRGELEGTIDGRPSGDIAVDGSGMMFPWLKELSRCGWGVVATCGFTLRGGIFGALDGPKQTVPRAELQAIWEALKWAVTPMRIISDHKNHVDAIAKGKAFCVSPTNEHVDLWKKVWSEIERHGGIGDELTVVWQAAHMEIDAVEDPDEKQRIFANNQADEAAKKGRLLHDLPMG